jgi:hypothetical protein
VAEILNKVNDLEAKVTTLATSSGTANPAAVADAELAEIKAKL